MKRSEINEYIRTAKQFFEAHQFFLPLWADWSPEVWAGKGEECAEIVRNQLGWDVTDFGGSDFCKEGLTLFTVRNGNAQRDRKVYCEKIMFVREMQVTPIHFHWKKMEDIINRGGGSLCMKLWKSDADERQSSEVCTVKIDGISTRIAAGEVRHRGGVTNRGRSTHADSGTMGAPAVEPRIYTAIGLDFETGGLDCTRCACTQIAVQALRLDTLETFDRYEKYIAPYHKQEMGAARRKVLRIKA